MNNLKYLIILFTITISATAKAQFTIAWTEKFQHTQTVNYSNEGRKVVVDSLTGNIYALCDVTSDIDSGGNVNGQVYSYTTLIKYSSGGTFISSLDIDVKEHQVNGFDKKSGFGLELDPSGNIYIGYTSYDAITSYDINIRKLNSNLATIWTYKYNAVTTDIGIDMKVTAAGTAYAIVKSNSGANIRHRIIKATGMGISAAAFYTFSTNPDYLNSIAVDASQNVYATGYRLVGSVKNILTVSLNAAGAIRWLKVDDCGTVTGDDIGKNIIVGSDGNIYMTGSSVGTAVHGLDVVTMKHSAGTGKKMWENYINNSLNDGGAFVVEPEPYFVYVAWSASNTVYVDQILNADGSFVRRASYTPTPVTPFNTRTGAIIADMKASKNHNLYITGSILATDQSSVPFSASYLIKVNFDARAAARIEFQIPVEGTAAAGNKSVSVALNEPGNNLCFLYDTYQSWASHNQEKIWLQNIESQNALRLSESSAEAAAVYFNNQSVALNYSSDQVVRQAELYDLSGKQIFALQLNATDGLIDMSGVSDGMYMVRLYLSSGEMVNKRVVKQ
jgi:hypothetical protein